VSTKFSPQTFCSHECIHQSKVQLHVKIHVVVVVVKIVLYIAIMCRADALNAIRRWPREPGDGYC
jgi:hypothetical protein